jgi:glycosyltransferase involved in cell wall biosynthesis
MSSISVVMPVYNRSDLVSEAIQSIQRQTLSDFEFIIVDDGSNDGTADVLSSFAKTDTRIVLVTHSTNLGLVAALNTGCKAAAGDFIAIMHSDDIALPQRLQLQTKYLSSQPQIGILGSAIEYIDADNKPIGQDRYPGEPALAGWNMFFYNSLAHPAVMFRRTVVETAHFYQEGIIGVEDFDLWMRALRFTRIASLPDVLLQYRRWGSSITAQHHDTMEQASIDIVQREIELLLHHPAERRIIALLWTLLASANTASVEDLHAAADLIECLYDAYAKQRGFSSVELALVRRSVAAKMIVLATAAAKQSPARTRQLLFRALRYDPLVPVNLAVRVLRRPAAYLRAWRNSE